MILQVMVENTYEQGITKLGDGTNRGSRQADWKVDVQLGIYSVYSSGALDPQR